MLRRVDLDDAALAARGAGGTVAADPVAVAAAEADSETGLLPREHPRWVRDAVAMSKAARELVARLKPVVVAVMTVWDHRLRCIAVGGRRVAVDASGSYKMES